MDIFLSLIQFFPSVWNFIKDWWNFRKPAMQVIGALTDNKETIRIFVKDIIVPQNTYNSPKLFSMEGSQLQANPNIEKVWPEVEAVGIGRLQNLLGRLGKIEKIEIVEMSKGHHLWDKNFIILGAQAMKCREFYEIMDNVGYSMDEKHIYDKQTSQPITLENGYGYGLIIKATKKDISTDKEIVGFLLGGFGTLGTAAAIYYFCNTISQLGKEFNHECFSIVVRARIASGEQSVKRLPKSDKTY